MPGALDARLDQENMPLGDKPERMRTDLARVAACASNQTACS